MSDQSKMNEKTAGRPQIFPYWNLLWRFLAAHAPSDEQTARIAYITVTQTTASNARLQALLSGRPNQV